MWSRFRRPVFSGRYLRAEHLRRQRWSRKTTRTIQIRTSAKKGVEAIDDVGACWTRSFTGAEHKVGDTFNVASATSSSTSMSMSIRKRGLRGVDGTDVIWRVAADGPAKKVQMIHRGLLPTFECLRELRARLGLLGRQAHNPGIHSRKGMAPQAREGAAPTAAR